MTYKDMPVEGRHLDLYGHNTRRPFTGSLRPAWSPHRLHRRRAVHVPSLAAAQDLGGSMIDDPAMLELVSSKFAAIRELEQDIPIRRTRSPSPVLCDGDGPIGIFRKWVKQFTDSQYERLEQGLDAWKRRFFVRLRLEQGALCDLWRCHRTLRLPAAAGTVLRKARCA